MLDIVRSVYKCQDVDIVLLISISYWTRVSSPLGGFSRRQD